MSSAVRKLRDLEFDYARAHVLSIDNTSRILVEWKLKPTLQNLVNLSFYVYRGESPEDLQQLNGQPIAHNDLYEYVDQTPFMIDLYKSYSYQVHAVEVINNEEVNRFKSPIFSWAGDLDLVAQYVVDEHDFLYRHTSAGMPALVYKKRHDGTKCPCCWDDVLKRPSKSGCTTCMGTGKIEGYYPPIPMWASFGVDTQIEQVVDWGVRQEDQIDVQMANYPAIRIGDVIYEIKEGKFWKIFNVRNTHKNRVTTLQIARLAAVKRSDVEYKLPVPEEQRKLLLGQLEERRREVEF